MAQQSGTRNTNPGNFANDREKAREAGRKGGRASSTNQSFREQTSSGGDEAGRKSRPATASNQNQ